MLTLRRLANRSLLLLALVACDASGPTIGGGDYYAVLLATASFRDSTTGLTSACRLSGTWTLPGWPSSTRVDTSFFYLSRLLATDTSITLQRDTLLPRVGVTLTRVDSVRMTLELGAPFNAISTVTLDSANGFEVTGAWPCPPAFPLSSDTALLNHGYLVDSIVPGLLDVGLKIPVD